MIATAVTKPGNLAKLTKQEGTGRREDIDPEALVGRDPEDVEMPTEPAVYAPGEVEQAEEDWAMAMRASAEVDPDQGTM